MRTYLLRIPTIVQTLWSHPVYRLPMRSNVQQVALTFDDGPDPESTPQLLSLLEAQHVEATFFLQGHKARLYPQLVGAIRHAGHRIAHHGYHHYDGWRTPHQSYIDNVARASDLLQTTDFRPPYGRLTPSQYRHLHQIHHIYMWSLMPGDFDRRVNGDQLTHRLKHHTKPRDIIVLHDLPKTIERLSATLPSYIQHMKSLGYDFVTIYKSSDNPKHLSKKSTNSYSTM